MHTAPVHLQCACLHSRYKWYSSCLTIEGWLKWVALVADYTSRWLLVT